jgi:hypothetical protein
MIDLPGSAAGIAVGGELFNTRERLVTDVDCQPHHHRLGELDRPYCLAATASSVGNCGESMSATARAQRSSAQPQKS